MMVPLTGMKIMKPYNPACPAAAAICSSLEPGTAAGILVIMRSSRRGAVSASTVTPSDLCSIMYLAFSLPLYRAFHSFPFQLNLSRFVREKFTRNHSKVLE